MTCSNLILVTETCLDEPTVAAVYEYSTTTTADATLILKRAAKT